MRNTLFRARSVELNLKKLSWVSNSPNNCHSFRRRIIFGVTSNLYSRNKLNSRPAQKSVLVLATQSRRGGCAAVALGLEALLVYNARRPARDPESLNWKASWRVKRLDGTPKIGSEQNRKQRTTGSW